MTDLEYLSTHEAGHLVAAYVLGLDPGGAFIALDGRMAGGSLPGVDGSSFDRAVVALAGLAATHLAGDRSAPSAEALADPGNDIDKAEAFLADLSEEDQRKVGPAVFSLLKAHWSAVLAVATFLAANGEVYREQLPDLIGVPPPTVVSPSPASDGFRILARAELGRSVYDNTILADSPTIYWRLNEQKAAASDAGLKALNAGSLAGTASGTYVGPPGFGGEPLIVKDSDGSMVCANSNQVAGTQNQGVFLAHSAFDLAAGSFVVEVWVIPQYQQASNSWVWHCEQDGGGTLMQLYRGTTTFTFGVSDAGGTTNLNSAGADVNDKRYHIVCKYTGVGTLTMWINGTKYTGGAVSGVPNGVFNNSHSLRVGHPRNPAAPGGGNWQGPISHFAVYTGAQVALVDDTWVLRHYNDGTSPWSGDLPGARAARVLDIAGWPAGLRGLDAGQTVFGSAAIGGQTALEHLQKVSESEYGSLFFIARDGSVRFVDRQHVFAREPYPIAFSDTVGEIGYSDLVPDDGDEVIRNRATISSLDGVPKTVENAESVAAFGRFDYVLDGLLY